MTCRALVVALCLAALLAVAGCEKKKQQKRSRPAEERAEAGRDTTADRETPGGREAPADGNTGGREERPPPRVGIPPDRKAVRELITQFDTSKSAEARQRAIERLATMIGDAEAATVVARALRDTETPAVRDAAAAALRKMGAEAVPVLATALEDGRSTRLAADMLIEIGKPAVPILTKASKMDNWVARGSAILALATIRPADTSVLPAAGKALRSSYLFERRQAAAALDLMGAAARPALPHLVEGYYDKDETVKASVVSALTKIGKAHPEVNTEIVKMLVGEDWRFWRHVKALLQAIGPPAVPALIEGLKDTEPMMRERCAFTLAEMEPVPVSAIPALLRTAADEVPNVRMRAVFALGRFGPVAGIAMPRLIKAVKDKERSVRTEAIRALGNMGPAGESAVSLLLGIAKGEDQLMSGEACKALARLGRDRPDLIRFLRGACKGKDRSMRSRAAEALGEAGPAGKPAVPDLARLLTDKNMDLRVTVARSLGKLGPVAKAALPALRKAVGEAPPAQRRFFEQAIQDIEGGGEDPTFPADDESKSG